MKLTRSALLAAGLASLAACNARESVDTILYNGNIVTLDGASTIAEAIAVRGDRIVGVGTDKEILRFAAAERMDLDGQTVVPGFADNHYHSIGGGPGVDLSRTRSLSAVFDALTNGARTTPPG